MPIEFMDTLDKFLNQDRIQIKKIICAEKFCRRLGELGLYVGAEIEIIKNDNFSPLILKIFDSHIALGRIEAQKIYGTKI